MNFAKFLRTNFSQSTSERLLLNSTLQFSPLFVARPMLPRRGSHRRCFLKFFKTYRKTPVLKPFFTFHLQVYNFIKKTQYRYLPVNSCEVLENTLFTGHLQATGPDHGDIISPSSDLNWSCINCKYKSAQVVSLSLRGQN